MDKIVIRGGKKLQGEVKISGAKNSALPILFSALLTGDKCHFTNVPRLQDIRSTLQLLELMGCKIQSDLQKNWVEITTPELKSFEAPYDLVRKMRASVIVLGPLLARFGKAKVSLPGGCAIGARPINFHLEGLKKLGAEIELKEGYVLAQAKRLVGNRIDLPFASVGATENLMLAASLAKGETLITNVAREPEIVDLANVLNEMGSEVEGAGSTEIRIQGKDELKGCDHAVIGDRIEAGTYLSAAFITGGSVKVVGLDPQFLDSVLKKFEEAGATIDRGEDWISLTANGRPRSVQIETEPFPGFPTDMQAQFMAILSTAQGESEIRETIFENRFMHVPELTRLGAKIEVGDHVAKVTGTEQLNAAPLMATDLRASASLILGGLAAKGVTEVSRVYHLDRGYENLVDKLRSMGADIERVST